MIQDARDLPAGAVINADICIIGGGAAGLSIASSLIASGKHVCLLESGGLAFEHRAQRLSRGSSVGAPYEALDLCRVRQFGGSTGQTGWGGWCKPLDPEDFTARAWIPLSGWPISREVLDPYYTRAAELLQLGEMPAPASRAADDAGPLFEEPCYLSPRANVGETLLAPLRDAPLVQVIVHATALRLKTGPQGAQVRSVEVAITRGKRFRVEAQLFVLAGGGIENARLLLLSCDQQPAGLGNQHDQVGRCFMEHPRVAWGAVRVSPTGGPLGLFDPAAPRRQGRPEAATPPSKGWRSFGLAVRPEVRASGGLLGSRTWIKPSVDWKRAEGAEALQYLSFWLRKGRIHRDLLRSLKPLLRHPSAAAVAGLTRLTEQRVAPRHLRFVTILEQEPDPLSRVTLDTVRDAFGTPRAKLDWRISWRVRHTLEQVQAMIVAETRRRGHECWVHPGRDEPDGSVEPSFSWVRHHMGTTRMSNDARQGVVDRDCRVHGVANLFVAGSSVFPTGGNDMPTLTIIALALRLAEHLTLLWDRSRLVFVQSRQDAVPLSAIPQAATAEPVALGLAATPNDRQRSLQAYAGLAADQAPASLAAVQPTPR